MATTTATLNVNATQALQTLTKVQKQVDSLGSAFGKLRNIIGGLAIGSFASNMLRAADAVDDLSKATGISIATIDGFGKALATSGGEAEDAATLITRFSQSLEEGREGTLKAENSFGKLGISIKELRTLSDEDVLRKTIEGLAKLPPGAQRTALAMELLGKSARTIDWNNLNGSIDAFITKAKEAEPGTKALAQLFDNLKAVGASFITQLTINGTSVADTLVKLTANSEQLGKALVDLTKIVAILGAAFGALSVIKSLQDIRNGIAVIGQLGTFARLSKDITLVINNFKRFLGILPSAYSGIQSLGFSMSNVLILLSRLAGYVGIIYAIGEAFRFVTGTINPVAEALKFLRDVGIVAVARLKGEIESLGASIKYALDITGITKAFTNIAGAIEPVFTPAINWLKKQFNEIGKEWRSMVSDAERALGIGTDEGPLVIQGQGAQAMPKDFFSKGRKAKEEEAQRTELEKLTAKIKNSTNAFLEQRNAQLQTLALQSQSVSMTQKEIDIYNERKQIFDSFTAQIEDYQSKINELTPDQEKLKAVYLGEIAILEKLRKDYMDLGEAAVIATDIQVQAQKDLQAELQRTFNEWRKITALQDLESELDLLGLSGDELERQQKLLATQREMRDSILGTMEQMMQLEEQLRQGTIDPKEYARQRTELEKQLETARQIAEGKLTIDEEYYKRKAELENSYQAGVKTALKDIAEQYKPINVAQQAVRKGWQAIENALDTFVETGKFKFSDFARSVIVDIGKMIAKMMIFKALEAGLNALSPGLGSLIFGGGKAKGGPVKSDTAYLVGEKGPELFVPQSNGSIVPNNRLGNGAMASQAAGPITNNFNTYNINALDAKSVAQLFAENRKAIFGANKMAEREMSYAGVR